MSETIGDLWRRASRLIGRLDARHLLEHVGACRHADLIAHPERELRPAQLVQFNALLERRVAGEPLAYLFGTCEFYGLEFVVSPDVLIPRADTEVLVDQALVHAHRLAAPRIVELGTGSGIIAIVLAKRLPSAAITAVDVSSAALLVAAENAARHAAVIRFVHGSWYGPLTGECFDLIVANPPYVAAGDPHLACDGLPFEPALALSDGVIGGDGLGCIRAIVGGAPAHLAPGGWLLIEHGYNQAVETRQLLQRAGFLQTGSWRDGAAIERVSGGCLP